MGKAGSAAYTVNETYAYDTPGQLTVATNTTAGYKYAYTYDTAGNIRNSWI